jgi:hypothetical protein
VPLATGNSWVYTDSVFNVNSGGAFDSAYVDSVGINAQTTSLQGPNGNVVFYGLNDPIGWFGSSLLGVDPSNTVVYGLDSVTSTNAFVFFETATADGVILGSDVDNTTNPSCPVTYTLYGYATTTSINGHTCLKNVQTTVNCSNITTETINTYVAPGVGVVRIEDYETDSTGSTLSKSFTQTLKSYTVQ